MLVSCLCPTWNRASNYLHLLGEAVESFLRQRLPDGVSKELIILNDTPGQKLAYNAVGVRVINWPCRIDSLGAKRNILANHAKGDVFFPWDDDDISLPGRISQALHATSAGHDYFNPQRSWWLDSGTLHSDHKHGYCHNASAFTREAWQRVGGYPDTSGNEDALMDAMLRAAFGALNRPVEDPADWQYIYRWGVSPRHLSGHADGPVGNPHGPHYQRIGQEPIALGAFPIVPAWRRDYVELCRRACA